MNSSHVRIGSTTVAIVPEAPTAIRIAKPLTDEDVPALNDRQTPNRIEFDHRGGKVTFSTDINIPEENLLGKIKGMVRTLLNRWQVVKKLDEISVAVNRVKTKHAAEHGTSHGGIGYTVSPPQKGRYVSPGSGKVVGETSYTVSFGGVDTKTLHALGEMIRRSFQQESVLIEDKNSHVTALWFGIEDETNQKKLVGSKI